MREATYRDVVPVEAIILKGRDDPDPVALSCATAALQLFASPGARREHFRLVVRRDATGDYVVQASILCY